MSSHPLRNYLRSFRRRAGLSQDELAYLLGTTCGSKVSRYERGTRVPTLETLLAYEAIFCASPKSLFAGRYETERKKVQRRAKRLVARLPQEAARKRAFLEAIRESFNSTFQI